MNPQSDAGMRAVARVRAVRERDSRLGLQHAHADQRRLEAEVGVQRQSMAAAPVFESGTAESFAIQQITLTALGSAMAAAESRLALAQVISDEAHVRWQHDAARVSAVQMLLDRRTAQRRVEADRTAARELDDIATQAWQRRQTQEEAKA